MTGPSRAGFVSMDPGALKDNITFLEWCEDTRNILHVSGIALGAFSSAADATFRKVSRGLVIASMTSSYRARQVANPIAKAAEALISAERYIITSANRYEAVFTPELEAAGWNGHRGRGAAHGFRAG